MAQLVEFVHKALGSVPSTDELGVEWKEEDPKFRASLTCVVSFWPTWDTRDPAPPLF